MKHELLARCQSDSANFPSRYLDKLGEEHAMLADCTDEAAFLGPRSHGDRCRLHPGHGKPEQGYVPNIFGRTFLSKCWTGNACYSGCVTTGPMV
jgi:hypothetical protein